MKSKSNEQKNVRNEIKKRLANWWEWVIVANKAYSFFFFPYLESLHCCFYLLFASLVIQGMAVCGVIDGRVISFWNFVVIFPKEILL